MTTLRMIGGLVLWWSAALVASGCVHTKDGKTSSVAPHTNYSARRSIERAPANDAASSTQPKPVASFSSPLNSSEQQRSVRATEKIQLVSAEQPAREAASPSATTPISAPAPERVNSAALDLDEVINSVISSYPLLQSAFYSRNIAQGELLQANGEFDLKLKADTLNRPLGFYENYRHSIGAEQPLFSGGSVFGGYRLGRGDYPAYYGERATKLGGEFKAGAIIPLLQNRQIDDRRAGIWRNNWEVQSVEPDIQAQLIGFVQAASIAYWNWVAAGQIVLVNEDLLKNATERNDGLKTRVKNGDASEIELVDNERLIVSRRTKLIDARRKFQQSAYKLSLFLRDDSGNPRVIDDSRLPREFPREDDPALRNLDNDLQLAIANRPELRALSIFREQLNIDLCAAENLRLPQLDAVVSGSQDVGEASSPKKDDKSPFELEGGVIASVPLQRRKAAGKAMAIEGKLTQVRAKSQFTQEKIIAEVQSASAALNAAFQQLELARRSLELARQMETAERRKFDLGDSNLLLVNLREQATADAASTRVEAHLNYFDAAADYRAALGEVTE